MTRPGMLAFFESGEGFVAAVRQLRSAGYRRYETFMPYPLDELDEVFPGKTSPVPASMATGGILGGGIAFFTQYYAAHDYPLNSGGRPLNSWPAFIPITFELTVLGATLAGLLTFLVLARLPNLNHPAFELPGFEHASQDRFLVFVGAEDPLFSSKETGALLKSLHPAAVEEIF